MDNGDHKANVVVLGKGAVPSKLMPEVSECAMERVRSMPTCAAALAATALAAALHRCYCTWQVHSP